MLPDLQLIPLHYPIIPLGQIAHFYQHIYSFFVYFMNKIFFEEFVSFIFWRIPFFTKFHFSDSIKTAIEFQGYFGNGGSCIVDPKDCVHQPAICNVDAVCNQEQRRCTCMEGESFELLISVLHLNIYNYKLWIDL